MAVAMPRNLILYQFNSACSFIPHVLLEELGLPHKLVPMKFSPEGLLQSESGEITHEQYLKIQPNAYVPALQVENADGSFDTITENPAILTYISSLKPERELLGRTPLERARVVEWLAWLSGTVHGLGLALVLRPKRFVGTDDASIHKQLNDKGREILIKSFDRMDERVSGQYAVGDRLTVVDMYLAWFWHVADKQKIPVKEDHPRLARVIKTFKALPSAQRTLKAEKFDLPV